jgi:hypothetical protein
VTILAIKIERERRKEDAYFAIDMQTWIYWRVVQGFQVPHSDKTLLLGRV